MFFDREKQSGAPPRAEAAFLGAPQWFHLQKIPAIIPFPLFLEKNPATKPAAPTSPQPDSGVQGNPPAYVETGMPPGVRVSQLLDYYRSSC